MRKCEREFFVGIMSIFERHVFLTGFMGAGKSTAGLALAKRLSFPFLDLDQEIERFSKKSISNIFIEGGEDSFRNLETKLLKSFSDRAPSVIALGGGTLIREENYEWVRKQGILIFLDTHFEILLNRLRTCPQQRPLIMSLDEESFHSRLRDHYLKRISGYHKAELTLSIRMESPDEIAEKIIHRIHL